MGKNHWIYSVAFKDKKSVSKYNKSDLFHYTSFQIDQKQSYELLPETRISSHNSCQIWDQNTYFSELFRVEWCRTAAGVKIILQRTLIKGRKQGLSAGA